MDRYITRFGIKTEIKPEIKTEEFMENDCAQTYQQSIIKEEVMLSDMSDAESESKSASDTNETVELQTSNATEKTKQTAKKQNTLASLFKRSDDTLKAQIDLNAAIREFTKVSCSKCKKKTPVVYRKAKCGICKTLYLYCCLRCQKTYKTYTDLCYHLNTKHVTHIARYYNCPKCDKSFEKYKRMNEHRQACNVEPSFKCQQCSYKAKFKSNLVSHVKSKHRETQVKCSKCGKRYTNERSLRRHVKVYCGKKKLPKCDHCKFKAYRKNQLVGHLQHKHGELFPNDKLGFKCMKCGDTFKTYYRFKAHAKDCTDK